MEVKCVINGPICTNTYIIINNNECIVIDPAYDYNLISSETNGKVVTAVLLTHGHFDHIGAVSEYNKLRVNVYIHKEDYNKLDELESKARMFGINITGKAKANKILIGNETIELAGLSIKVIHTPGHSIGSVCYIIEDNIFSGDTLFYNSYGRVDFVDGDFYSIKNSIINKLFTLKGDYKVYPGHDKATTLNFERENNPIQYEY